MTHSDLIDRPPWHVPPRLLAAYVDLDLDMARSASVEQHLIACEGCRASLATVVHGDKGTAFALDALWLDVIDSVDRPRLGLLGRVVRRIGVSDGVAAVVAATPALRLSWALSLVVVLAFAVTNAMQRDASDALFLAIAPLIPLVGIGAAYGAGADPLFEVMRSAPLPASRIFLYRSSAVIVTAIPLTMVASLAWGVDGIAAVGWLLPALGLVGATMALATWVAPPSAALVSGSAWVVSLIAVWMRSVRLGTVTFDATFAFQPSGQLVCALVGVAGAVVFAARFERLDRPGQYQTEAH